MISLDLTKSPPRSGYERVDGVRFLPRTIDKARALLPGGTIGAYQLRGISHKMFKELGLDEEQFIAHVRDARNEEEVASWVRSLAGAERIAAWNELVINWVIRDDAQRADLETRYEVLRGRSDISRLLDLLDVDDGRPLRTG